MASLHIEFSPHGMAQYSRVFTRFAENISDLKPLFELLGRDFLKIEKQQFESEGAHGSGGWPRLTEPYRTRKGKNRPGRKILVFDGDLKNSLTRRGATGSIWRVNKDWAAFGTSIHYAKYHQDGTSKMKKRPPIEFATTDSAGWNKIVHEWLFKTMTERLRAA